MRTVHGVPGDYILSGLDHITRAGLSWKGNVNELEAGYAADGYARVAGLAALVTTFGVGELSAINALAGAYAEDVPIIHIVGAPPTAAQHKHKLMHHTLGNGDYQTFKNIAAGVACFVADLSTRNDHCSSIDRALRECVVQSKPVYIYLPVDLVTIKVDAESLSRPLDLEMPWNEEAGQKCVHRAVELARRSKRAAILVGHGAMRQNVCLPTDASPTEYQLAY